MLTACPEPRPVIDPAPKPKAEASAIEAIGPLWFYIETDVPSNAAGGQMVAAVVREGRLVGMARADVPASGPALLAVRLLHDTLKVPGGRCTLWLTLDRNRSGGPFPGFGDAFQKNEIDPPAVGTTLEPEPEDRWVEKKLSTPGNLVTFHYHRFDGMYEDVSIWTWDPGQQRTPPDNELLPSGRDAYGLVFEMDRSLYANGTPDRIGLLPRQAASWNRKDGSDRYLTPEFGSEAWLIAGNNRLYARIPDIAPHVISAHLDQRNLVGIELSHAIPAASLSANAVTLSDASGRTIPATEITLESGADAGTRIQFRTAEPLDPVSVEYFAKVGGFGNPVSAVPRGLLDDPDLYSAPDVVMGTVWSPADTVFRVFAPTAHEATVVLYDAATGDAGRLPHPMAKAAHGIWELRIAGNLDGRFYAFRFDGPGLNPGVDVVDIHATNTVDSTRRARITDFSKTNPPGWTKPPRGPQIGSPVDAVIFEMHVRDFTIAPNSGTRNKGMYLGFAESGTRLASDPSITTGLDHLVELGVTHVQLLPVQDFQNEEAPRLFNWGYVTNAFNSPEGLFATDLMGDARVRELKTLIAALHARGIGVILDVVYNHTGEGAFFDPTVPGYYYRMLHDGSRANGSGCGNEFRTEAPMARKFLIDSLKFWVTEYGVDGFRFDLMALLDSETMRLADAELRKIRPDILLYGEPWQSGGSPLRHMTDKGGITGTGIGAFNDDFRNAIKGSPDGEGQSFLQRGFERGNVEKGMEGSWRTWAKSPAQTINYMTCHDNLVLYDKLKISRKDADDAAIQEMMRLGYLILFTSQGVPFFHGGEEFARSKGGNENSYEAPDSVNQVDWDLKKRNLLLNNYVRDLISMRKRHPMFRLREAAEIAERVRFHHAPTGDTILMTVDGQGIAGETWNTACVLVNGGDDLREFTLPPGRWQVAFDREGKPSIPVVQGSLKVPRKSGLVLREATR